MSASKAARVHASVWSRATPPEYVSHDPRETSDTCRSLFPSFRCFMRSAFCLSLGGFQLRCRHRYPNLFKLRKAALCYCCSGYSRPRGVGPRPLGAGAGMEPPHSSSHAGERGNRVMSRNEESALLGSLSDPLGAPEQAPLKLMGSDGSPRRVVRLPAGPLDSVLRGHAAVIVRSGFLVNRVSLGT